jgi:hypothetical protein
MGDWMPIETAPTDGTEIFTSHKVKNHLPYFAPPAITKFHEGEWCAWFGSMLGWGPFDPKPTHWKPKEQPND